MKPDPDDLMYASKAKLLEVKHKIMDEILAFCSGTVYQPDDQEFVDQMVDIVGEEFDKIVTEDYGEYPYED